MNEFSKADAEKFLNNPGVLELMEALKNMDADTMRSAAQLASSGETESARAILQPIINDPRIQQILKQLGG
jgi:hypothetical protein